MKEKKKEKKFKIAKRKVNLQSKKNFKIWPRL